MNPIHLTLITEASDALKACEGASAFSLYGGYSTNPLTGKTKRFSPATIQKELRNKSGRVTSCEAWYSDGSKLKYTWSESKGPQLNLIE